MQRHHKKRKAKVMLTIATTVLLLCIFVLPSFAIVPPDSYAQDVISFDDRISQSAAEDILQMVKQMDELRYFVGSRAFMLGYYSDTTKSLQLYTTTENVSIVIGSDSTYRITGFAETYRLTEYGWKLIQVNAEGATIPSSGVVAYRLTPTNDIVLNTSFTYGTWEVTTTLAQTIEAWDTYYDSVINYDENIDTAYDNGYTNGYSSGYADGYASGIADGGGGDGSYQEGYEVGYREGSEYTYPIAYQEGYNDGLIAGSEHDVIIEQLDVGSIISSLPAAAKEIINGALGFEIFGINVAGTLTAILVVAIVGFVVKWLLSLKS